MNDEMKKDDIVEETVEPKKSWHTSLRNIPLALRIASVIGVIAISLIAYGIGNNQAQAETADKKDQPLSYSYNKAKKTDKTNYRIRRNDDKWEFSADNGSTWTTEVPKGFDIDKDDKLTWKSDDGKRISEFDAKENQWRYSEDGGKSWSDPINDIENWLEDGLPLGDGVSIKFEDGKTLYSTDGGKTWSEDVPEGFSDNFKSVITKQSEDGKTLYSIDGGKTWTEDIPEGYEIPDVDELLESIDSILDKYR